MSSSLHTFILFSESIEKKSCLQASYTLWQTWGHTPSTDFYPFVIQKKYNIAIAGRAK